MEAAICSGLNCFSSCFSKSFQTCADIRGAFLHPSERTPDIFNTDQGSRFSSVEFIKVLVDSENKISMDGKGAWRDNVFVERLWRTIKYEEGYLWAYGNVPEARATLGRYIGLYKTRRPHSTLDGKTPDQAYFNLLVPVAAAA